jgi:hypothetical protein
MRTKNRRKQVRSTAHPNEQRTLVGDPDAPRNDKPEKQKQEQQQQQVPCGNDNKNSNIKNNNLKQKLKNS